MVGLEPTTPGLEVRCAIHCATPADVYPASLHLLKPLLHLQNTLADLTLLQTHITLDQRRAPKSNISHFIQNNYRHFIFQLFN